MKDPRTRLAAICDIRPERLDLAMTQTPAADKAKSYKDARQLLARPEIDAVLIATPVYLHPEHFELAADDSASRAVGRSNADDQLLDLGRQRF